LIHAQIVPEFKSAFIISSTDIFFIASFYTNNYVVWMLRNKQGRSLVYEKNGGYVVVFNALSQKVRVRACMHGNPTRSISADAHHQVEESELIDSAPFNPDELTPEGMSIYDMGGYWLVMISFRNAASHTRAG
jgi:hypothetical protein